MQKRREGAVNLFLRSAGCYLGVEAQVPSHPVQDIKRSAAQTTNFACTGQQQRCPFWPDLAASACRKPRIFGPEKASVPSAPRSGAGHLRQTTACYRSNPIPPATHSPSHFLKRQQLSLFGPCSSCCQKEPSGAKFSEAPAELTTRHLRAPRAPRSSLSAAR